MAYLNLVVKGTRYDAAKAASARHIPFAFSHETKRGETVGRVATMHLEAVRAWLAEPGEAVAGVGFPPGTLLTFAEINR